MRHFQWIAPLAALLAAAGCQNPSRRVSPQGEPALSSAVPVEGESSVAVIDRPATTKSVAFVDRHPLFSKPRDYYEKSKSNKVGKTAVATVVGVPAGIYGEFKQIVVGAPASP